MQWRRPPPRITARFDRTMPPLTPLALPAQDRRDPAMHLQSIRFHVRDYDRN
jgi:hypothetical protein